MRHKGLLTGLTLAIALGGLGAAVEAQQQGGTGQGMGQGMGMHHGMQGDGPMDLADRFGEAACRFIREHKEEPFFLFVSFTAPHGPLQAKPEHLAKLAAIPEGRRRNYAGLMLSLDENVGRILDCLEEEGLAGETLVVFTNDNGGQTALGADNTPLSGRKGSLLEGGVRVPFAVRWPGTVKPGTVIDDPVISLDLLPTFVTAAGGEVKPEWELDGVDLAARLSGRVEALAERPLFWRQHGSSGEKAVRLGRWKLHVPGKGKGEARLFDLSADVAESRDLSEVHPEVRENLLRRLAAWEAGLEEPLWGPGAKK